MFGRSFDRAILPGPLALHSAGPTAGKAVLVVWLYGCRCLPVEGDPVCGATQVLPDCHQRQSDILFWLARTIGRCFIVA
ncbi:MAG: hypothetical protein GDA36_03860 [Rhodobacteraceae bacterium]|nr:hypothetical protein [Paracoccaceae bacterium]